MRDRPYRRRSIRLKNYDYSSSGIYFVTICTYNRQCLFGKIINGEMILSETGRIVGIEWINVAIARENIMLDEYIIMPNHFHGILWIKEINNGITNFPPKMHQFGRMVSGSLSAIIRGFKSAVTNRLHRISESSGKAIWQRNFYEHVIRDETSLNRIREYIISNPLSWELDRENSERKGEDGFYSWLASFKTMPKVKVGAR